MQRINTGSSGVTIYYDSEGNPEYPCPCGEVHTGPYAIYDYGHHTCPHDQPLLVDEETGMMLCPSCGKDFWAES